MCLWKVYQAHIVSSSKNLPLSVDSITEYGGYHTFIHNILEKKSCQDWVLEMYSSPQFKAVALFFTTEWDNKSWYTFPWFICSHFSLRSRKVLPLPISILNESHAELMDVHLPYEGSQESLNHVKVCIRHLPNYCVTDETGRPVSWMLSDELRELRMAYTLPEYRRARHFLALSLTLIGRMISVCLPVYCHVHQQNQAAINAVASLGYAACPGMENMSVQLICKDRQ